MRSLLLLPVLAIVFPGFTKGQTPVSPEFAAALQQKLDSCRNVYDVPGISATLLFPGDRYWNGTAGLADIYTLEPLDTFHVFQAASVTKLFVSTMIFQLVEEGLVALDDTIGHYLPPMTNVPPGTQIRYLLNHRSGIAEFLASSEAFHSWFDHPDSIWTPEVNVNTFTGPQDFEQNSAFAYSNTNYLLLGMLIEQVTGNTFAQELHERFIVPLGLEHTFFPPMAPVEDPLTPGWTSWQFPNTYDTDVTPVLNDCYSSMAFTAGALVASPSDLARFTRSLGQGQLISAASLATMRTCTNVNFGQGCNGYGHGTMRYIFGGRTYFGHAGDINGFTQLSVFGIQDSVTVVISINRNNAPRGTIAAAMLAVVHEQLTAGIDAISEDSFDLFPVPAHSNVTLRYGSLRDAQRVDLIDATGSVVRSENLRGRDQVLMDLEGLGSGVYHVRVHSNDAVLSRKLVVQ